VSDSVPCVPGSPLRCCQRSGPRILGHGIASTSSHSVARMCQARSAVVARCHRPPVISPPRVTRSIHTSILLPILQHLPGPRNRRLPPEYQFLPPPQPWTFLPTAWSTPVAVGRSEVTLEWLRHEAERHPAPWPILTDPGSVGSVARSRRVYEWRHDQPRRGRPPGPIPNP
jgi:hypothetical protein